MSSWALAEFEPNVISVPVMLLAGLFVVSAVTAVTPNEAALQSSATPIVLNSSLWDMESRLDAEHDNPNGSRHRR